MNNTNFNTYFKSANRGDFQWSPIDIDDWTGQILSEECTYKGQGVNVVVSGCKGNFTIDIDHLIPKPYYICDFRSSRKSAREFAERIIKNDREGDWQKNLKYC